MGIYGALPVRALGIDSSASRSVWASLIFGVNGVERNEDTWANNLLDSPKHLLPAEFYKSSLLNEFIHATVFQFEGYERFGFLTELFMAFNEDGSIKRSVYYNNSRYLGAINYVWTRGGVDIECEWVRDKRDPLGMLGSVHPFEFEKMMQFDFIPDTSKQFCKFKFDTRGIITSYSISGINDSTVIDEFVDYNWIQEGNKLQSFKGSDGESRYITIAEDIISVTEETTTHKRSYSYNLSGKPVQMDYTRSNLEYLTEQKWEYRDGKVFRHVITTEDPSSIVSVDYGNGERVPLKSTVINLTLDRNGNSVVSIDCDYNGRQLWPGGQEAKLTYDKKGNISNVEIGSGHEAMVRKLMESGLYSIASSPRNTMASQAAYRNAAISNTYDETYDYIDFVIKNHGVKTAFINSTYY